MIVFMMELLKPHSERNVGSTGNLTGESKTLLFLALLWVQVILRDARVDKKNKIN